MAENKQAGYRIGLSQTIFISLLIVSSFLLGSLYTKVQFLEKANKETVPNQPQATATGQAQQQPAITIDQIKSVYKQSLVKFGDEKKKVIFVEISDPSCPFSHIAAGKNGELNKQTHDRFKLVADGGTYIAPVPEMEKLVNDGKAAFAYIYTPGHGNGEMGTKALYCAFEKGKFWQVHDVLMTNAGYNLLNNTVKNDKTKSGELANFLAPAMNASDMKSCLDSGKYDTRLGEDTKLAASIGITGTPGFIVNTTVFTGAYSYKDIEPTVKTAL